MIEQQYKTQREEDRALGRPIGRHMKEDPRKRGVPLFLQHQNRRPTDPKKLEALRRTWGRRFDDPNAGRVDHRKPRSVPWDEWDAILAREAAAKRAASLERVARLRAKKGLPPLRRGPPHARRATAADPPAGSKTAMIADLMMRPGGCTTADVLAATGWTAVSMPAQAALAGLDLRKERVGGLTRYYGTRGLRRN